MANKELAEIFNEMADMLSVDSRPTARFEVRAYQNAAMLLLSLDEDVSELYRREGKEGLMSIKGIGKGLADKIEEYIKTGHVKKYDKMKKEYPIDFANLTKIEGMGAKKAIALYKKLGVKDIPSLKSAIEKHEIRELEGFGERSEQLLAKGVEMLEVSKGRLLLSDALPVAESIVSNLLESRLVEKAVICGSTRRMKETIGDIDILAISKDPEKVMDLFVKQKYVSNTVVKGPTKTTVLLGIGTTCDLRVISPESFGAAMQYFTGSKEHNVEVRKIAISKGYKLNEYGLYDKNDKVISAIDERDIYSRLGMDWIEPEMRENRGEIALAKAHKLPKLVNLEDLRGDLHSHTVETDGTNTLEEMANAAIAKGFEYLAVTNHTKSLRVAHGMDEKKFTEFFKRIDALNEKLDGKIKILKGAEVDILKDGSLDLDKSVLGKMDCVIGAVHSNFNMGIKEMTDRVKKAIGTGSINILAHPTGRIINEREPYALDLRSVAESAEKYGVAMEIDAYPTRLDLNDSSIFAIRDYKVMFSVDSDAHNASHFDYMRYGIGMARRGWLQDSNIINTMRLKQMAKFLPIKAT
ncbi:MAG: DNA polymerase/3'-5' exonuclease PolX [Candidatus Marsarchaeota archaeon]|nr:DNA polymerase/3'-5' exonuclease PolX [Candidatus Marsarchaeota archaeon]